MNVRVVLRQSIHASDNLDALARIVHTIVDGWHEWLGPDPDEPDLLPYFEQYRTHRELLRKSYTRSLLYPLESRRTIVVAENADVTLPPAAELADETTLSLAAAAILLSQPLLVLVENERNDGAFFSRILEVVDSELVKLFREPRPRIRFDNGGGKTVIRDLIRHRANASRCTGVPLRLLVLADSDSRYPGHEERDTSQLKVACKDTGASLFVLDKRAIENYVMDRVLSDYAHTHPDVARSVNFILALPSTVRDHYPIKKGVPSVNGKADVPDGPEMRLYSGVAFPADFCPKLPRAAEQFVKSSLVYTTVDLAHRGCELEAHMIARWMREEL